MKALKELGIMLVVIVGIMLPIGMMLWGMKLGIEGMQVEAVRNGKAEYLTNEAGQQVWRWKP